MDFALTLRDGLNFSEAVGLGVFNVVQRGLKSFKLGLYRWFKYSSFFKTFCKTYFHQLLSYLAFCRPSYITWSLSDLKYRCLLNRCDTCESLGLSGKAGAKTWVPSDGRFTHHSRHWLTINVLHKSCISLLQYLMVVIFWLPRGLVMLVAHSFLFRLFQSWGTQMMVRMRLLHDLVMINRLPNIWCRREGVCDIMSVERCWLRAHSAYSSWHAQTSSICRELMFLLLYIHIAILHSRRRAGNKRLLPMIQWGQFTGNRNSWSESQG